MEYQSIVQYLYRRRRTIGLAFISAPIFALIYWSVFNFRYEGQIAPEQWGTIQQTIGWVVLLKVLVFGWFRIYQGWTRYITFHDMIKLAEAVTVSSLILLLAKFLCLPSVKIARSLFVFDWGATLLAFAAVRSTFRFYGEVNLRVFDKSPLINVLIVGANASGEAILRTIRRSSTMTHSVVGFISEDKDCVGTHISGVPVVGGIDEIFRLAKDRNATELWITAGELSGRTVRELVDHKDGQCQFTVRVLPSYEQLIYGQVALRPRKVSIEDLLRRDPVELDLHKLQSWLEDRVLLITGSAGSIGSEICRQLIQFMPRKIILVDRSENGQFFLERELRQLAPYCDIEVRMADIRDVARMDTIFSEFKPDIVFHAAAYKHVPLMEANIGEGVKNIVLATRCLADLAHQHRVGSFVMVSTDKAVNPTSVMGTCKRVAELYVQQLAQRSKCRFVTVRFGNVLDSAGSVVQIFRDQIARGGPVSVTHPEMTRYFMTIPEASQLVIQAGAMGRGGEIFVLDMGEPVRIVDLATDMIRLSGLEPVRDIEIEFVGMRPGEKLFEELHIDGERHLITDHPKIMVAESDRINTLDIDDEIEELMLNADEDPALLLRQLHAIVPQHHQRVLRRAA